MILLFEQKICTALSTILLLLPLVLPLSAAQPTGMEITQYGSEPSPEYVYDEIQNLPWYRYLDSPGHQDAEQYISSKFSGYGLEVSKQEYMGQRQDGEVRCANVLGFLEGERADQWLVIGGHYDTNLMASQGAYDNGVGVATVMELARLFTTVETERPRVSIMFAAWDSEEGGGAGSRYFVENLENGIDVVAYINLDMFGLNYPVRNSFNYLPTSNEEYFRLYMYTSPVDDFSAYDMEYDDETLENFTDFRSCLDAIVYDDWQYPQEWVTTLDDTEANSDQRFFIQDGLPAVWFRGMHENAWEEGDTNEQTFKHTPIDTLATMELYAGGRTNLLEAFETALVIAYDLGQMIAGVGEKGSHEADEDDAWHEKIADEPIYLGGIVGAVVVAVVVVSYVLIKKRGEEGSVVWEEQGTRER